MADVRQMTDVEAAWVGALIEGEGTVYLIKDPNGKTAKKPGIQVGSTEIETIATCLRLTQAGRVHFKGIRNYPTSFEAKKPVWVWQVSRFGTTKALLKQIVPYLTSKQDKAKEILAYTSVRNRF